MKGHINPPEELIEEASGEEMSGEETSWGETSGEEASGEEATGEETSWEETSWEETSWEETSEDESIQEVETNVGNFLIEPTLDNWDKLGATAVDDIDVFLQSIKNPGRSIVTYVEALCCVAGLSGESVSAAECSSRLFRTVIAKAKQSCTLADALLCALQFIKPEHKYYQIRWRISSCFSVLAKEIDEPYFPAALRNTLKCFIYNKMESLPVEIINVVEKHPNLYT